MLKTDEKGNSMEKEHVLGSGSPKSPRLASPISLPSLIPDTTKSRFLYPPCCKLST